MVECSCEEETCYDSIRYEGRSGESSHIRCCQELQMTRYIAIYRSQFVYITAESQKAAEVSAALYFKARRELIDVRPA